MSVGMGGLGVGSSGNMIMFLLRFSFASQPSPCRTVSLSPSRRLTRPWLCLRRCAFPDIWRPVLCISVALEPVHTVKS
ncbi:hypothetical protein C8J56DRAFT_969913 [Mycena floridula]|nr:hypothetical protein C8J56DRAFT_969913 [Mycena floridula]